MIRRSSSLAASAAVIITPATLVLAAGLPVFDNADGSGARGTAACVLPFAPAQPTFGSDVLDPEILDLSGLTAERTDDGSATMRGGVQLKRGDSRITAGEVQYEAPDGRVIASGDVQLWSDGAYVRAPSGILSLPERSATLEDAEFALISERARGRAETLTLVEGQGADISGAYYTTCEPGNESWALVATSVNLDQATEVGTARNVRVELGGVPVFYTPYLSFPLTDKRKSGVLVPTGRVSSTSGVELTVPYYFNIAPDRDATLSLRGMSRRGLQIAGEYRQLWRYGTTRGTVEYLPNDRRTDDSRLGISLDHRGKLSPRWSAEVDYGWVSDRDYFADLGTTLRDSSADFVDQFATVRYAGVDFDAFARVQGFQLLDDDIAQADKPYRRLPQVSLRTRIPERNFALNWGAHVDVTHFDRSEAVTGIRAHAEPYLSFPMRTAGAYVVPKVSLAATHYSLRDTEDGDDNSPTRLLPRASIDAGMSFERSFSKGAIIHSIEPRLFYVAAPSRDQDDIPLFDTTAFTDSYEQLFREDRFAGLDRLGDDHRLTLGLGTALRDSATGAERFRFDVGQIRFFRDREITLAGDEDGDGDEQDSEKLRASDSDLFARVSLALPSNWHARYGLQWDPGENQTNRHAIGLGYRGTDGRTLNAAYRFRREDSALNETSTEQVDLSFAWPLTPSLRAVGRVNHALADGELVDAFGGIEYTNCCLSVRTLLRRHLVDEKEHSNALMFQLELRGLTGLGRGAEAFITRSIAGYGNDF